MSWNPSQILARLFCAALNPYANVSNLQCKKRVGRQHTTFREAFAREARTSGAPWVSKSTHPRKFGYHVTVHRQPAPPSAPQA